jgi:hypothetical protein
MIVERGRSVEAGFLAGVLSIAWLGQQRSPRMPFPMQIANFADSQ